MSKADLSPDPAVVTSRVRTTADGVTTVAVSAVTRAGIEESEDILGRRTAVFVGPSGVGKSSIVNALCAAELLAVRDIRRDRKGRHTTTHRQMVLVPGEAWSSIPPDWGNCSSGTEAPA